MEKIEKEFGWKLEHLKRTDEGGGFSVIPKRWVWREHIHGLGIIED
jgi:putative transposase